MGRRYSRTNNLLEEICTTSSCNSSLEKGATVSHELQIVDSKTDTKGASVMHQFKTSGNTIVSRLSFTHLRELMTVSDPLARYFYEQECVKCTWSVRELRRQISTNLYVRAGISSNPEKMLSLPSIQGHDTYLFQGKYRSA